jgi:DNA-binding NtrC family response regulator
MANKILVVDDEDYMREIVKHALEATGYVVEEAADGDQALQMIRKYPYDVIVTDLRLPGPPGEHILREALAIFPETIVIIMTGFGSIQTAVEAIRIGAYDYLPKPFQLDELAMRVEKGLLERLKDKFMDFLLNKNPSKIGKFMEMNEEIKENDSERRKGNLPCQTES